MRRTPAGLVILLAAAAAPPAVHAQAADPAAAQIQQFDDALLSVMKDAKRLGPKGRYGRLEPVIRRTFDLPAMTRFAVGSSWSKLTPAEQAALVQAFSRMTVATYAHNFDGYAGERFVSGPVETRGVDKLVHTQLISPSSGTTNLTYRMRQSGGAWKVIDVYYNGAVSSLLGQRSEYASTLGSGGAKALITKLNSRADQLLAR
ncbi:MAG: hopanoid biosynthesis protein HpnM [Phenylobacterium sp.]|nr:hopanoid biosynthesis protein HpnM [Phenylobacterium sp.]